MVKTIKLGETKTSPETISFKNEVFMTTYSNKKMIRRFYHW